MGIPCSLEGLRDGAWKDLCGDAPNALVSPFFQPHLHGASGMWALPTGMVSAVHPHFVLPNVLDPAVPDLLAVQEERGGGQEGQHLSRTSAYRLNLWAS